MCDLNHFLGIEGDAPAAARRMAAQVYRVVRAATAVGAGPDWPSALACWRRPDRRPCTGRLLVGRAEVPPAARWRCPSCGDEGVVRGWERSPFDLRAHRPAGAAATEVLVSGEAATVLQGMSLLSSEVERVVFGARWDGAGAVLSGAPEDMEELLDSVAEEANKADTRAERARYSLAYDELTGTMG